MGCFIEELDRTVTGAVMVIKGEYVEWGWRGGRGEDREGVPDADVEDAEEREVEDREFEGEEFGGEAGAEERAVGPGGAQELQADRV